jgi:hypothetical protein
MDASVLIGTWRLERWELVYGDGRPCECPLGPDAVGFLMYTRDGYVSAQLARAARPAFDPADPTSKARAFDDYFAYTGRYAVRGDSVFHTIALAPNPAMTGAETERRIELDGDRLTLSGPDFSAGSPRLHRIIWRRAG